MEMVPSPFTQPQPRGSISARSARMYGAGEMILPSHMTVSPAAIGAMIAGGVLEIEVIRKPVVGIIPTGDEIIPPCTDPKPGDILEFNGSIFSARCVHGAQRRWSIPLYRINLTRSKKWLPKRPDRVRYGNSQCRFFCRTGGFLGSGHPGTG